MRDRADPARASHVTPPRATPHATKKAAADQVSKQVVQEHTPMGRKYQGTEMVDLAISAPVGLTHKSHAAYADLASG